MGMSDVRPRDGQTRASNAHIMAPGSAAGESIVDGYGFGGGGSTRTSFVRVVRFRVFLIVLGELVPGGVVG